MTDLSRGVRSRRSGRRPGWLLLTVLLVLAIAASSALVFTERVELLKLAVILSLWAAAVAAFVSVIYRRQSDIDRAKARDLKLVYDLQLDREISARREYELEVESQLRRELATELRAQAADEVAALRAELAALRNNLEILFDADLSHRPALEPERTTVRAYSDWHQQARFVPSTPRQDADDGSETAIIDVPEEPPVPEPAAPRYAVPEPAPAEQAGRHGPRPASGAEWQPVTAEGQWLPPGAPGSNWVTSNGAPPPPAPEPMPAPMGPEDTRRGRHSNPVEPAPNAQVPPQAPPPPPPPEPPARHGASGEGQSVAELMARLQSDAGPTGGGRRRRRDG